MVIKGCCTQNDITGCAAGAIDGDVISRPRQGDKVYPAGVAACGIIVIGCDDA